MRRRVTTPTDIGTIRIPRRVPDGPLEIPPALPLLLLPMRLEYRVLTRAVPLEVIDTAHDLQLLAIAASADTGHSARAIQTRETARRAIMGKLAAMPERTKPLTLTKTTELWFRWYPDEAFSEDGIPPVSSEEAAALETFRAAIGSSKWWDATNPTVCEHWQALAGAVGASRAVHLLRAGAIGGDATWEARIGRIAALPARVELFAAKGPTLVSLGAGADIPPDQGAEARPVAYTPDAFDAGGWMRQFDVAVASGMGLKLADDTKVVAALAADWIIAVGIHRGAATTEIESLLRDQIANGEFEFLPQDAPTNNAPGGASIRLDPHYDTVGYLGAATALESDALGAAGDDSAASLTAGAMGIDATILQRAVRANDQAFADARAMLRVVAPALLDGTADRTSALAGVDENTFIEVMASCMAARGPLPPVRCGKNAYGLLPLTEVTALDDTSAATEPRDKILGFLRRYAGLARAYGPGHADQVVPVMKPADAAASAVLESILKSNRTSVRIDVAVADSDATKPLGCPYVTGAQKGRDPASYLAKLATSPLKDLPDPPATDRSWPLLYRLARISLDSNVVVPVARHKFGERVRSLDGLATLPRSDATTLKPLLSAVTNYSPATLVSARPGTLAGIDRDLALRLQTLNKSFLAALRHLQGIAARPDGSAQLEVLLLEAFDLLQHRVDAWATGLAFEKLQRDRRGGRSGLHKGLHAGYYGMLGKLRRGSATAEGDGFILAPSPAQAVSAAVLRSAYLRHRDEGAFAINLRSRRARRGMAMLELLRKGHTLGEALGLRGERWLRDQHHSALIFDLRLQRPLRNPTGPGDGQAEPAGRRVFDGKAFLEKDLAPFGAEDRQRLTELKQVLGEHLDALSDLIMAEAVHQRAIGAADAGNAWLQVLGGEPVPDAPVFLRTKRLGQGSTHRISLMVPVASPVVDGRPRAVAEPSFAALAAGVLAGFGTAKVKVKATRLDGAAAPVDAEFGLVDDLGLDPIDLVIGGSSELNLRAHQRFARRLMEDPALTVTLAGADGRVDEDAFNQELKLEMDLAHGDPMVTELLERAEILRRVLRRSRALDPADLNAAAAPGHVLDEQAEIPLIRGAVERLRSRAQILLTRLTADRTNLGAARNEFALRGAVAVEGGDAAANAAAHAAQIALRDRLWAVSAWAEPRALAPVPLDEALADLEGFDRRIRDLEARLETRAATLQEALAATATPTGFSTVNDARNALNRLTEAIRATLDREALPILPPFELTDAVTPLLGAPGDPVARLAEWGKLREAVADAAAAATLVPGLKAHEVKPTATTDDEDEPDDRPEATAPRSRHFGIVLDRAGGPQSVGPVAGLVLDEWAEQRPSEIQTAGVAINYDTPQAEAPNCLLLCVPSNRNHRAWGEQNAAQMVVEAIAWMKVRALSTQDKPTPAALLPGGLQVAYKQHGQGYVPRLPQQELSLVPLPWNAVEGRFEVADRATAASFDKSIVNERLGFRRVKE